jgi:hypothetical protein
VRGASSGPIDGIVPVHLLACMQYVLLHPVARSRKVTALDVPKNASMLGDGLPQPPDVAASPNVPLHSKVELLCHRDCCFRS